MCSAVFLSLSLFHPILDRVRQGMVCWAELRGKREWSDKRFSGQELSRQRKQEVQRPSTPGSVCQKLRGAEHVSARRVVQEEVKQKIDGINHVRLCRSIKVLDFTQKNLLLDLTVIDAMELSPSAHQVCPSLSPVNYFKKLINILIFLIHLPFKALRISYLDGLSAAKLLTYCTEKVNCIYSTFMQTP